MALSTPRNRVGKPSMRFDGQPYHAQETPRRSSGNGQSYKSPLSPSRGYSAARRRLDEINRQQEERRRTEELIRQKESQRKAEEVIRQKSSEATYTDDQEDELSSENTKNYQGTPVRRQSRTRYPGLRMLSRRTDTVHTVPEIPKEVQEPAERLKQRKNIRWPVTVPRSVYTLVKWLPEIDIHAALTLHGLKPKSWLLFARLYFGTVKTLISGSWQDPPRFIRVESNDDPGRKQSWAFWGFLASLGLVVAFSTAFTANSLIHLSAMLRSNMPSSQYTYNETWFEWIYEEWVCWLILKVYYGIPMVLRFIPRMLYHATIHILNSVLYLFSGLLTYLGLFQKSLAMAYSCQSNHSPSVACGNLPCTTRATASILSGNQKRYREELLTRWEKYNDETGCTLPLLKFMEMGEPEPESGKIPAASGSRVAFCSYLESHEEHSIMKFYECSDGEFENAVLEQSPMFRMWREKEMAREAPPSPSDLLDF